MKTFHLIFIVLIISAKMTFAQKYEFRIVTTVESIVPNGFGSSKMVSSNEVADYRELTISNIEGSNSRNATVKKEHKVKAFEETQLLNFYNLRGIRFHNITSNDAVVTSKLNALAEDGWDLAFVNSGIESSGGRDDNAGFLITRYVFKRMKPVAQSFKE